MVWSQNVGRGRCSDGANNRQTLSLVTALLAITAMFSAGCSSSSSTPQHTLTGINVTPATASVGVQGTQQFKAEGTFSDNSTQDLTASATWSSSATNVATVNSTGVATGVAVGSATISATSGSVSGTASLTVTATSVTLASIAVTPANASLAAGSPLQFDAVGTYTDNSTQDLTLAASWSSSSMSVATITTGGLSMGVSAGNTTITAKVGSVSGSTSLTVSSSTSTAVAAPDWLEFVGDGSESAYSCSGHCNLQGEHWVSSFQVTSGATLVVSNPNVPLVIRSTGTCTIQGTISNSSSSGAGGNTTGHGDFGAGGGGGGAGSAGGQVGYDSVGDSNIEIVLGGSPGSAPGGNGGNGANPTLQEYKTLLSGGTFWPVGGSVGGQGGSNGGAGGAGGGVVILVCNSISFTGTIDVSGGVGGNSPAGGSGAGGGGGAGYVIFSAATYPANTGTINTSGGPGGSCNSNSVCGSGGSGGSGWSAAFTIPQ